MVAFIDPKITNLSENERAVIEKYGFELRDENGHYDLIDPEVRKARGITAARYIGGNITTILRDAVSARKLHDTSMKNGKVETDAKSAEVSTEVSPNGVVHGPMTLAVTKPKVAAKKKSKAAPVIAGVKDSVPETDPETKDNVVSLPKLVKPPTEIVDPVLDNTGKRERAPKKEKGPKKVGRYERAALVIVGNLTINEKELSKKAGISVPTAGYCLKAWEEITKVLTEKGLLKLPPSSK